MKSSSNLFPVTLLRAEKYDDINEDIYLLKHNRDADKSVQIALTHLSFAADSTHGAGRTPVVFNHGSFSNRSFWYSNKGIGLARFLLDEGFDVWLLEQRGHGFSPRNDQYHQNDSEHYIIDFKAVNDFLLEQTEEKPIWIGHSLGGIIIASAVACNELNSDNCLGFALIGAQPLLKRWYTWVPFATLLTRITTYIKKELSGRALKIGPENEPHGVINEYLRRQRPFARWRFKRGQQNLMPLWKQANDLPLLTVCGKKDKPHPVKLCRKFNQLYGGENKHIIELGNKTGFSKNYGHVDMIVSKDAAQEVWPAISDWLKTLTNPLTTNNPKG